MKLSLTWLEEYTAVPKDLKAFCDRLDLTGTGVEGVETLGALYENIVTAQVLSKEPHPDSDHMWVCKVDVGQHNLGEDGAPEPLQIVCGAQNFDEGDHIVTALVGAVLPGDLKIKKSKLRGVVSCGMNCSERELGLSDDHGGIMILPKDAPVGMPIAEYLGNTDTVLDLEITPNRPDCLSVVGLAREVGAMYQQPVSYPLASDAAKLPQFIAGSNVSEDVTLEVTDPERCPRYTARVIDNVKVAPSPAWLAERITAEGARSINNIVDVTNYILFLYGQPLHAFDYDRLRDESGRVTIIVRPAEDGEEFTTLDGTDRVLNHDMTVISTPQEAIALAGVMGGLNTEVEDDTTTILLETATFSRAHTSRTSRSLGLISEASMRYERGVDAAPIEDISAAAAALIAEVGGGTVRPGIVDLYPIKAEATALTFRIDRFNAMMGADIPREFIVDVLERLGCVVEDTSDESLCNVIAPTFRPDLEREIDLYEEVLRLWGMDRITSTLPSSSLRVGVREPAELVKDLLNATLRASGLNETMTYSFAEPSDTENLRMNDLGMPVELMNPLNAEQSIMRQTIIGGLLRSVAYNQHHGTKNVQLYEIGTVFSTAEGRKKPKERTKVAAVLAGAMGDASWNQHPQPFDFFDGKGVIENIARELALPKLRFKALSAEEAPYLQPGRGAEVLSGGTVLGWVGELHPLVVTRFDAQAPVVAFELDLNALVSTARPARDYVDVPTFPSVEVDQAFIVDEAVTAEKMEQVMTSAGGRQMESVRLFDVYRDDEKIGVGKKSMAFTLTYRAQDRTLTGEEVEKVHSKIVKKVQGATGAEIRA